MDYSEGGVISYLSQDTVRVSSINVENQIYAEVVTEVDNSFIQVGFHDVLGSGSGSFHRSLWMMLYQCSATCVRKNWWSRKFFYLATNGRSLQDGELIFMWNSLRRISGKSKWIPCSLLWKYGCEAVVDTGSNLILKLQTFHESFRQFLPTFFGYGICCIFGDSFLSGFYIILIVILCFLKILVGTAGQFKR